MTYPVPVSGKFAGTSFFSLVRVSPMHLFSLTTPQRESLYPHVTYPEQVAMMKADLEAPRTRLVAVFAASKGFAGEIMFV